MLPGSTKPSLTPGPPESAGVSSEGIRRAEEHVRRAVEAGVIPLADVALVRRGILVWRASFVNPDLAARGYRLDAASLYYLCSITKVFVATLIMQQVERGRVYLDPASVVLQILGRAALDDCAPIGRPRQPQREPCREARELLRHLEPVARQAQGPFGARMRRHFLGTVRRVHRRGGGSLACRPAGIVGASREHRTRKMHQPPFLFKGA